MFSFVFRCSGTGLAISFCATVEDFQSCAGLVVAGLQYGCCGNGGPAQGFLVAGFLYAKGETMGYFGCFGGFGLSGSALLYILGFVFPIACMLVVGIAGAMRILFRTRMSKNFGILALVMAIGAGIGVLSAEGLIVAVAMLCIVASGFLFVIALGLERITQSGESCQIWLND